MLCVRCDLLDAILHLNMSSTLRVWPFDPFDLVTANMQVLSHTPVKSTVGKSRNTQEVNLLKAQISVQSYSGRLLDHGVIVDVQMIHHSNKHMVTFEQRYMTERFIVFEQLITTLMKCLFLTRCSFKDEILFKWRIVQSLLRASLFSSWQNHKDSLVTKYKLLFFFFSHLYSPKSARCS